MKRRTRLASSVIAALWISAGTAGADTVLDWNATMVTVTNGLNPFAQARLAAIAQLAVFEAVNSCTGRYEPYVGTVPTCSGGSADAAAATAAHGVLKHFLPANAATLDAALAASLAAVPDKKARARGIAAGEAAAAVMVELRAADGAAPPQTFLPGTTEPGVWQPTPPAFTPGILLHWRHLTPFAIKSGDQFRSDPPPALTSRRYARDYNEVMRVGSDTSTDRPQDRADVARYFAVASAVHAWNSALRQVAAAQRRSLAQNARALALLNVAIGDGLVSSMETKYFYELWRPVTAIERADGDGNRRTSATAGWLPFVTTPAFPSYPSAHASASYAARHVIERLLGVKHVAFTLTHAGVPDVVLEYTSFADLTDDIDDARIFGGIHFRFDQEAGAWQGRQVGAYVVSRYLRPVENQGKR